MTQTAVAPQEITHSVECYVGVTVQIDSSAPDDIFSRAESEDFQRALYGSEVSDRQGVLDHWAYNAILNRVNDASRLDGWADLQPGMVTFHVTSFNLES